MSKTFEKTAERRNTLGLNVSKLSDPKQLGLVENCLSYFNQAPPNPPTLAADLNPVQISKMHVAVNQLKFLLHAHILRIVAYENTPAEPHKPKSVKETHVQTESLDAKVPTKPEKPLVTHEPASKKKKYDFLQKYLDDSEDEKDNALVFPKKMKHSESTNHAKLEPEQVVESKASEILTPEVPKKTSSKQSTSSRRPGPPRTKDKLVFHYDKVYGSGEELSFEEIRLQSWVSVKKEKLVLSPQPRCRSPLPAAENTSKSKKAQANTSTKSDMSNIVESPQIVDYSTPVESTDMSHAIDTTLHESADCPSINTAAPSSNASSSSTPVIGRKLGQSRQRIKPLSSRLEETADENLYDLTSDNEENTLTNSNSNSTTNSNATITAGNIIPAPKEAPPAKIVKAVPSPPKGSKNDSQVTPAGNKGNIVSAFSATEAKQCAEKAKAWLDTSHGRAAGYVFHNKDVPSIAFNKHEVGSSLELGGEEYQRVRLLGSGGCAKVYSALSKSSEKPVALKVQSNDGCWEYYMSNLIMGRVPLAMGKCFMRARQIHQMPSGSVIVSDLNNMGTLQDLINLHLHNDTFIDESVVLVYAIEIVRIISALHQADILHADVKPDNFLIRKTESSTKLTHVFDILDCRGLQVIDFGQSIDLRMYPRNVQFNDKVATAHFQCIEMKTGRPWKYQCDYYAIACTVHSLLFRKYMEIERGEGAYRITEKFKRYWNHSVWSHFFDALLNPTEPGPNYLAILLDYLVPFARDSKTRLDETNRLFIGLDAKLTDYLKKTKSKAK